MKVTTWYLLLAKILEIHIQWPWEENIKVTLAASTNATKCCVMLKKDLLREL